MDDAAAPIQIACGPPDRTSRTTSRPALHLTRDPTRVASGTCVAHRADMNDAIQLTTWTAPVFDEVKMDAEIGSYQQDDEREWTPLVEASQLAAE